MSSLRSEC